jgi:Leucine-rich repeat (LRR) protein
MIKPIFLIFLTMLFLYPSARASFPDAESLVKRQRITEIDGSQRPCVFPLPPVLLPLILRHFDQKTIKSFALVCKSAYHFINQRPCLRVNCRISDADLIALLKTKQNLSSLDLSADWQWRGRQAGSRTNSGILNALGLCPMLTSLSLKGQNEGYRGDFLFRVVTMCTRLTSLTLEGNDDICDEDLLPAIPGFRNLTQLNMEGLYRTTARCIVAIAQNCPDLAVLNLKNISFNDEAVMALAQYSSHLERLDIRLCNMTDDGLIALMKGCPKLGGSLNMQQVQITDRALKAIAPRCQNLTSLSLRHTRITDESLVVLAPYIRNLTELDLWCCKEVTDKGVRAVVFYSRNLITLDLGHTKITEASLRAIAWGCPKLLHLGLYWVFDLSKESKEDLMAALPNMRFKAELL